MSIQSVNPTTNEIIQTFEAHSEQYVSAAIERADSAFLGWKSTSFEERSTLLKKLAKNLREEKAEYAAVMTLEMGKVKAEALAEVEKCAALCDYYAENGRAFLSDEALKTPTGKALLSYEPLGVILGVMPWNFPFWQVFRFAVPTIMAGNTVLLKHASNVSQCSALIEKIFEETAFPIGVFQHLLIEADRVAQLIEDDRVKAVSLTGSEKAGAAVASLAASKIKKSVLELGGSDPFIVLGDADLNKAARIAAKSRMINCGQSCIAAKRFILVERIADEFLAKFKSHLQTFEPGDPSENGVKLGPMASERFANQLLEQVEESVKMGAKIALGGRRPDREGAYFEATILTDVTAGMPAYKEELFGPVAAVIVVKNEEEAIQVANDTEFGLGGSIWTADTEKGVELARSVQTGAMFINALVASDPALPFGGIKKSGFGRELGYLGIHEFVNIKTIYSA